VFGISKQAFYQRIKAEEKRKIEERIIIEEVLKIRQIMPKTGTRKLMKYLHPILIEKGIKMGRDALFDLLRYNGLLVKKTKCFHITTNSKHFFYTAPNRIKDLEITHAEQVLVSDITYIRTDEGYAYLALVTDAYSKKLMGWNLDSNMKVEMVKAALEMAHKNLIHQPESIIHHSDRGIQYCCPDYTKFAENLGFAMSTTQKYDPYENAVAERINGILKYEFGLRKTLPSIEIARKMVKQAVEIYNNYRLHWSLDLKTPQQVHNDFNKQKLKKYGAKAA
jgi:putative transposase